MIANALSVDVEEYYHATIFQEATAAPSAGPRESRVERSVDRLLRLFADHETAGTFFVLGEVAAGHRRMVQRIAAAGHEIACHGHAHALVSMQTPAQFRADVHRAKRILEDLTGQPVLGYRAPSFSIGTAQDWAYDVLVDEAFAYDSSSYPILHDRYGRPDGPRFPHVIRRPGGRELVEFPIGTARCLGVNLPIGGGGWFRLLPGACVRRGIRRVNTGEGRPAMFFIHPWELDPDQPKPAMAWHRRFRLYVGLARSEAKLTSLLRAVRFTSARAILADLHLLPSAAPIERRAA